MKVCSKCGLPKDDSETLGVSEVLKNIQAVTLVEILISKTLTKDTTVTQRKRLRRCSVRNKVQNHNN